jgi:triosephosphate isomerase (TIM)
MEKNKILALNHKMNLLPNELNTYIDNINIDNKNLIVFPMSIYLPYFINKGFSCGVQNISHYDNGSYTGELSALSSSKLGAEYTIIGHSERRSFEDDKVINLKILQALKSNLKVILCIGELTNNEGKEKILKDQINNSLENVNIKNVIIAYEPVWAIGTGLVPTNEEINNSIKFIKDEVKSSFNSDIKVLYGGSVNEKNISAINSIEIVDGYLVGGASLDYNKVLEMIKVVL